MKRITTIFFGLLLSSSLTATAASAQNTSNPTLSPISRQQEVIKDAQGNVLYVKESQGVLNGLATTNLGDQELWIALLLTMVAGGFGGFVFELLNLQGNIERKHDPTEDDLAAKFAYASPENVIDLGVRARIIIGMFAAPPAILYLQPGSVFALIAMSVVAGSAGTGFFRALQDRFLIAIVQSEKEQAQAPLRRQKRKRNAKSIKAKLQKALLEFEKLENEIRTQSESLNDPYMLTFPKEVSLDPTYFCNVWKPLNEAKGIDAKTVDPLTNAFKALELELYREAKSKKDTSEITILQGKTIELKYFIQVKKLLSEAIGTIEAVENSNTPLEASESPLPKEKTQTSQSDQLESNNGQNASQDPAHVN